MTTLNKTVSLDLGAIVTDIGPAIVNGAEDPRVRQCRGDNGCIYLVLARVIETRPEVTRRAELSPYYLRSTYGIGAHEAVLEG